VISGLSPIITLCRQGHHLRLHSPLRTQAKIFEKREKRTWFQRRGWGSKQNVEPSVYRRNISQLVQSWQKTEAYLLSTNFALTVILSTIHRWLSNQTKQQASKPIPSFIITTSSWQESMFSSTKNLKPLHFLYFSDNEKNCDQFRTKWITVLPLQDECLFHLTIFYMSHIVFSTRGEGGEKWPLSISPRWRQIKYDVYDCHEKFREADIYANQQQQTWDSVPFMALLYLNEPSLEAVMVYSGYISLTLTG